MPHRIGRMSREMLTKPPQATVPALPPEELHRLVAEARRIDGLLDNFRVSNRGDNDRKTVCSHPHLPSLQNGTGVRRVWLGVRFAHPPVRCSCILLRFLFCERLQISCIEEMVSSSEACT